MHQVFNYVEVLKWAFPTMRTARLSPTECYLFLYLLHRSNSVFWRELRLSVAHVTNETGIKHSAFFLARKKLQEKGFLLYGKGCQLNFGNFPDNSKEVNCKKKDRQGTPAHDSSHEERLADLEKFFGRKK